IDTGMGLERTASVLQNVPTNFHIDILFPIVQAAAETVGQKYEYESDNGRRLRRITDHVRACTFAIHENVYPGPKKARYVIKRLLRRAVLDGHQMGMREPFLHQLVPVVANMMKSVYPELATTTERVAQVMKREEADFFATIDSGLERIHKVFGDMSSSGRVMVDGREAASLYQTHGVPPEMFQQIAAEKNYTFDWDGYRKAMAEHGEISGGEQGELFETGPIETLKEALHRCEFLGYETTRSQAQVKGIIVGKPKEDRLVSSVSASTTEMIRIVLDQSPFYGESGGQVGDSGRLETASGVFEVTDTQRSGSGELKEGDTVSAIVDTSRRDAIKRAHSATHILHHALQTHVGSHAQQQGSKVDADWLRFDFSNQESLPEELLQKVESLSNQRISESAPIDWKLVPLATAREAGAMMLFGEKYPDPVRMVSMGSFSKELCGGTHASNTNEIQTLEILAEESVSSGTRRITALTGAKAIEHRAKIESLAKATSEKLGCSIDKLGQTVQDLVMAVRKLKKLATGAGNEAVPALVGGKASPSSAKADYSLTRAAFRQAARLLNVSYEEVPERLEALLKEQTQLHEQIKKLSESGGSISVESLLEQASEVGGTRLIVAETPNANAGMMRQWIDQLRKKTAEPVAVLLANRADDKVTLIAGISQSLVERGLSAGKWITPVAELVGGGGGGKPDLAQAGGKIPAKLPEALQIAKDTWASMLA
nr:alanine--tRNA ligase-related protein [Pirellula sp.]